MKKLGEIIYKGEEAWGYYRTEDFEGFDTLREARRHAKYCEEGRAIYYMIDDDQGNPLYEKKV